MGCFLGSGLLGSRLLRSRIAAYSSVKGVKVVGCCRANLRYVVHCHILSMVHTLLLSAVVLLQLAYALLLLCLLSTANAGGSILYHASHLHHRLHLCVAVLLLHL